MPGGIAPYGYVTKRGGQVSSLQSRRLHLHHDSLYDVATRSDSVANTSYLPFVHSLT